MMSVLKKLTAGALAALTLASFTACSADTSVAMTVGGTSIRAGVYIQQLISSTYAASGKVSEQYKDADEETKKKVNMWNESIDGVSVNEWIKAEAEKDARSFAAVEQKFAELGLELDTSKKVIETNVSQVWEKSGKDYEKLGVSKQSYEDVLVNNKKAALVFEKYYSADGAAPVSDADLKAYFTENYMRIKLIAMPTKDGSGNLLKTEGKQALRKLADEYASRAATAGTSFDTLIDEYTAYRAKEVADATGSSAPAPAEKPMDPYANEIVLQKDSSYPSKNFIEKIFASAKDNTPLVIEDDDFYFVAVRLPIGERAELFTERQPMLLSALKGEEFTKLLEEWGDALTVVKNEDAIKRYDPKKLMK